MPSQPVRLYQGDNNIELCNKSSFQEETERLDVEKEIPRER